MKISDITSPSSSITIITIDCCLGEKMRNSRISLKNGWNCLPNKVVLQGVCNSVAFNFPFKIPIQYILANVPPGRPWINIGFWWCSWWSLDHRSLSSGCALCFLVTLDNIIKPLSNHQRLIHVPYESHLISTQSCLRRIGFRLLALHVVWIQMVDYACH